MCRSFVMIPCSSVYVTVTLIFVFVTGKKFKITSSSSSHFMSSRSLLLLWKDVRTGIVYCRIGLLSCEKSCA